MVNEIFEILNNINMTNNETITLITSVVIITTAFFKLNYKINYLTKVVKNISEQLGIKLFDDV